LTQEGNIVLGEGGDINDEENVVFENAPPQSEEESYHDKESIDKDALTQLLSQVMPYNLIMSFGRQVIWHCNKRKQCIKHKYAIAGWALCIMEDV
jgi:hypothetical protein